MATEPPRLEGLRFGRVADLEADCRAVGVRVSAGRSLLGRDLETARRGSRHPALLLLAAVSAGIVLDRYCDLPFLFWGAAAAAGLLGWLLLFVCWRSDFSSHLLLAAWAALGGGWHHVWWNVYPANEIGLLAVEAGTPTAVELRVLGEPRRMALAEPSPFDARPPEPRTLIPCAAEAVRDGEEWQPVSGILDLYVRADWREVNAGDRIRVVGELAEVARTRNPGEFDFARYFRGQRKLAVCFADSPSAIEVISRGELWWQRLRAICRARLDDVLWRLVPGEYAGLASGVLLGNRQQIIAEQRDRFMLSSTVHVISISGLHVGILAALLFALLRLGFIERHWCLWGVLVLVPLYAWLVEFSPPVTRATVLICLFCASRLSGQTGFSLNLLSVAGLAVLAINPSDLFNLGAQLSFLAVASMIGADAYRRRGIAPLDQLIFATRSWPVRAMVWSRDQAWDAFRVGAVIWLLALPLVAAQFQLVSPVGLLVNPVILLPMAGAMYFGMAVLLLGWWVPAIGSWAGWACGGCLACLLWLVDKSLLVPGGYFWTVAPPLWSLLIFYLGAWFLFLKPRRRYSAGWLALAYVGWWALGWSLPQFWERGQQTKSPDSCELTFVDVGHGLSTLVRLPDGRHLLYDAGSFGASAFGVRNVTSVLWERGIEHLDAVVLSHADLDHFNALPEISRRFSIGAVYVSPQMLQQKSVAVEALKAVLAEQMIPLRTLIAGDVLQSQLNSEIACLGPSASGTGGGDNSDSIVLAISCGGRRALLTGDLEGPGLEQLLRNERLGCDLLVAPHHGSAGSFPEVLASWAQPRLVVISCSERRLEPESLRQYASSGAKVMATGEMGAIGVRMGAGGLEYSSWRGSQLQHWERR